MRIFSLALVLLLSGCGKPDAQNIVAAALEADRIECAVAGSAIARDCIVERDGDAITVRRSDGGFRRFEHDETGALVSADGAEAASSTTLSDGRTELSVAGETYRLPAE
jgi:hypothetical protein